MVHDSMFFKETWPPLEQAIIPCSWAADYCAETGGEGGGGSNRIEVQNLSGSGWRENVDANSRGGVESSSVGMLLLLLSYWYVFLQEKREPATQP